MALDGRVPLARLERWLVGAFLAAFLVFGVLVEMRSAFLSRRMGDVTCFLRGAWAVRTGTNLYEITDNNGWHYNYPPFFAIVLVPFADPPTGIQAEHLVPFPVIVAFWYLANLFCLAWASHSLATVLERHSLANLREGPRFCRRWWALRLLPVIVCLVPIGHTLMRSQVNLLILAMLCSMIACFAGRHRFRAGIWLALASAIKIIPVFLVIYPMIRRDGRCLVGLAAGWLVTLVVVPFLALGPERLVNNYAHFGRTLLGPALKMGGDGSRQLELLSARTTDNQSLPNTLFNIRYPQPWNRPLHLEPWAEWSHRVLGVLLTALTFAAGYRARFRPGWPLALFFAALLFLMTILSPVCHLHYFTNLMPLVMALLAERWEREKTLVVSPMLVACFVFFLLTTIVPHVPGCELLRDRGLPLLGGLPLWVLALTRLYLAPGEGSGGVRDHETHSSIEYCRAAGWKEVAGAAASV